MKRTFTLSLLCLSVISQAQTDTTKQLPAAEVTAQRLNVFSIGQTQLQSDSLTLNLYKNQHLSDYLQAETPLSIRTYGTGLASVAVRGMAANHTAVLWNGINIQNPLNGLNDMALLDVGSTQKIDVKLGGNSALFGSGAIGGVVYLDNEKPKTQGFHGQIGYGLGSYGFRNFQAELAVTKKKIGGSLRFAHQAAKNDFLFRNTAEIGQPLQRATHAAYDLLNINANVFAELTSKDFLKVNFWQSHNERDITPTMTARNDNAVYSDSARRGVAEWTHFFQKSYLKVRGAFVFDKNHYNSDVVQNSQNNIGSYIGETEWNYDFSSKHTLRAGFNTTFDQSENSNYNDNHQRTRLALFVNDAITTKFITLTANIRQEYLNKLQPTTFSFGFEKKLFESDKRQQATGNSEPSATPHYPLSTIHYQLILRGSFSRNFNVPTFNDLYWAELGNANLETEQGWSKEIGISYKSHSAKRSFQAHLTAFAIDMTNRIVWQPQTDGRWRPTNINRFLSRGIETWARFQGTIQAFSYKINAQYQYVHATDGNGGVQLFVPAHNGGVSAWLLYRHAYLAWSQTASSRRFGTSDKTAWTDAFTLADATLGFTPSVNRGFMGRLGLKTELRLQVSNIFNTDYQVIRFYPNPKRMVRLGLSLGF